MNEMKKYLNTFSKNLRVCSAQRTTLTARLRADLNERLAQGESPAQVLATFGSAKELAEHCNQEFAGETRPQATPLAWAFLLMAVVCIVKNILDATSLQGVFYQPTFLAGIFACVAAFLLFGWCRMGTQKRFVLPMVVSLGGCVMWGYQAIASAQMSLTHRVPMDMIVLDTLQMTLTSGVLFCVMTLVYAVMCARADA